MAASPEESRVALLVLVTEAVGCLLRKCTEAASWSEPARAVVPAVVVAAVVGAQTRVEVARGADRAGEALAFPAEARGVAMEAAAGPGAPMEAGSEVACLEERVGPEELSVRLVHQVVEALEMVGAAERAEATEVAWAEGAMVVEARVAGVAEVRAVAEMVVAAMVVAARVVAAREVARRAVGWGAVGWEAVAGAVEMEAGAMEVGREAAASVAEWVPNQVGKEAGSAATG